jgi:Family of unknown function (DUF5677)
MHGAYLHGFRRLVAIRTLAGTDAGTEAIILARSLLSITARAAYVDAPSEKVERRERWDRFYLRHLRDRLQTINDLREAGFDIDDDTSTIDEEIERLELEGVKRLPDDRALLRSLNLEAFYARLYRPSSDHIHFSLQPAINELRGAEVVMLETGDAELADEALKLAILTYGVLLQLSEKSVGHGLSQTYLERVRDALGSDS